MGSKHTFNRLALGFGLAVGLAAGLAEGAHAQAPEALTPWQGPVLQLPGRMAPPPPVPRRVEPTNLGPAAQLFRHLRSVGLAEDRIFHVREAVLDRGELRLYLTDGTIAFTQDVDGRITGAFFVGEGEVLMRPPDLTERASLGLFSGLGVLTEHFAVAYLRADHDLLAELKPFLREADEVHEFFAAHDGQSRSLAEMDALRLLESFSEDASLAAADNFLHARLGTRLGNLDVYYDALAEDQFRVARLSESGNEVFFDGWMSFAGKLARQQGDARIISPVHSPTAVAVEAFHLDTVLTPPEMLEADADLDIAVHQGGQRLLTFELSRWLQVSRVTVDGRAVEFLQNDAVEGSELQRVGNDLVTLVLPVPLKSGEQHRVHFHYAGAVMQPAAPGLLFVGARGTWYPNRGIAMSSFTLRFHWPTAWTLVATGERTMLREKDGMSEGEWQLAGKAPLAGFNLGKFVRATAEAEGVPVASYSAGVVERTQAQASPERVTQTNQAIASRSAADIARYTRWFGPFPYKSLSITQLPGEISQAWPTLVYLTSYAYMSEAERRAVHVGDFENLIYAGFMQDHETAHQWWGDRVGWRGYRNQWLMEALANLSALMIMEEDDPKSARRLLEYYREQLLASNANGRRYADAGPVTLGYRLSSSVFPNAYIPVTYGRGLWLMCMLRDYFADMEKESGTSDGRFLAALREFIRRYEHKAASAEDFRRVMEEFLPPAASYDGKRSLEWFFEEWVQGSSVPRIELRHEVVRRKGAEAVAEFDLEQKECPESLATSVPIYAELADGQRVYVQRVFADGYESHLTVKVPAGTRRILADPDHRILRLE